MYRLIFILISGILAFASLCIGAFQPKMHKTLFVYDSDYTVVEPGQKPVSVKSLPTQINRPPAQTVVKTVEKKVLQAPKTSSPKAQTTIRVEEPLVPIVKTQQQITANPLLSVLKETSTQTVPKVQTQTQQTQTPAPKTITEEEKARQEVILWNKWRSDLQNKIMTDVKLPIMPEGTIFRFSFDVDMYGKISNVQTWSLSPECTPYAIQYIAPVIRGYQGREILNFPQGSNRVSTTVEGGWKISQTAKYSTPDDYKDSEKIIQKD